MTDVAKLRAQGILVALLTCLIAFPAYAFSNTEQLEALNKSALAAYAAGRQEMLSKRGPLIIVGGDIALFADGKESRASITPQVYTNLKSIAHIALGTIGLLQAYLDDPAGNSAKWRPLLEALKDQSRATEPILGTLGLSDDALARGQFIVGHMSAFMESVLARGTYSRDDLTAAAREMAPYLPANANDAARAQIDMLHAVVQKWRADMSPEDWGRIRVFVLGPRMPRDGNLTFTYFRFAMGEDAVDKRLIYGENVKDDAGALSLLGTILTDRSIGVIAFGDEMRMDRDLLADGAQAYLLQLFGKLGQSRPKQKTQGATSTDGSTGR